MLPGLKPDHPDADRLAVAMRKLNDFADAGGGYEEAISRWVAFSVLNRHADMIRDARHADGPPLSSHMKALGAAAFGFGFVTARLFIEPDTTLTPAGSSAGSAAGPQAANPFQRPGTPNSNPQGRGPEQDHAQAMLAALTSVPALRAASDALDARFAAYAPMSPGRWDEAVADIADAESLRYAARQTAFVLNGIVDVSDMRHVMSRPDGQARVAEAVGMFLDGFLLGAHFPDSSARA